MMPGETGRQLTETLRQDSSVPILLLTAMNETENRIAGFECGADDYLPKPFEPRELVLRINAILRRVPPPPSAVPQPSKVVFGEFCFDLEREELPRAGHFVRLTTAQPPLLKAPPRRARQPIPRHHPVEDHLPLRHAPHLHLPPPPLPPHHHTHPQPP